MANIQQVTDLDFASIKNNLKDYFKRSGSPFKDWDFDGSGLNYLLDILAYNTHYNAVNAHLSMNESFLDSAQLRSNAVSRAKLIGYTPRSRRGARTTVSLSFSRNPESFQDVLILPKGTRFNSSFAGESYTFATIEDARSVYDPVTQRFNFSDLVIYQGDPSTRVFYVDDQKSEQFFLIDDENIDTSTLEVKVVNHKDTTQSETFLNATNFSILDGESSVYFLSENYEGKYQIEFGDGIIGKKLENLSVVEVNYLSSVGSEANGVRDIQFVSTPNNVDFSEVSGDLISYEVSGPSYGGDERETIESVRQLAPLSYIAQNRTITDTDYETLIRQNIPDVGAISIWGGEYNVPPVYGKVFISLNPKNENLFLTELQKEEILRYLETVKVMTVTPEIVDPDYVFLYFDIFFKYNQNLTTFTQSQLNTVVQQAVEDFNTNNLGEFDRIFRYSNFLTAIDNSDPSITNSFARIYTYKPLSITAGSTQPITLDFRFKLFGEADQKESFISSTSWSYNNYQNFLADEPISGSSNLRRVYVYRLAADGVSRVKVIPDVGTINIDTGLMNISPLPSSFNTIIEVSTVPNSYDIKTIRNQLVSIDVNKLNITGSSDSTKDPEGYDTISRFRE